MQLLLERGRRVRVLVRDVDKAKALLVRASSDKEWADLLMPWVEADSGRGKHCTGGPASSVLRAVLRLVVYRLLRMPGRPRGW